MDDGHTNSWLPIPLRAHFAILRTISGEYSSLDSAQSSRMGAGMDDIVGIDLGTTNSLIAFSK